MKRFTKTTKIFFALIIVMAFYALIPLQGVSTEAELMVTKTLLKTLGLNYSLDDLNEVKWLDFRKTKVSDNDLRYLKVLQNLRKLDLRNTAIGDEGLSNLKQSKGLETLWLTDTKITNNGLHHLYDHKNLRELYLPKQISDVVLKEIKNALPDCNVARASKFFSTEKSRDLFIGFSILGGICLLVIVFSLIKFTYLKKGERVLFGIGICFFIISLLMLINAINFVNVSKITNGHVEKLILKHSSSGSKEGTSSVYYPRVKFRAEDGREILFTSDMGSNPPSYDENEPVQVQYNPYKPEDAEIYSILGVFTVFSYALAFFIFALIMSTSSGGLKPVKEFIKKRLGKGEKREEEVR